MSSNEEVEVKAGHPPALKVGGMRIPQRHKGTEDREEAAAKPTKASDAEKEEEEEEVIVSKSPPKPPVVVSGVVAKVERDFPTAAVKHTHEKPLPSHDPRLSHHVLKPPMIQQPRK